MSSLIEQAAKRLEELRLAGIDIPAVNGFLHSKFDEHAFADTVPVDDAPARKAQSTPPLSAHGNDALHDIEPEEAPIVEPVPVRHSASRELTRVLIAEPPPAMPRRRVDVDLARLAGMGYLVPSQAQSLLADLLRVIKRPLLQNIDRPADQGGPMHRGNVIVVTSAVPGEGKTFVASNLAMSIAMEVDRAALLVDGDVLRPSVFSRLNLEPQTGLMDALVNPRLKVTDLMVETNIAKLSLLSAGTAQDRAEELLASAAMDHLLDHLSARFHDRVIIIDSPPLLVTTESRALAERAGQVVLVVEADRTPREQIARAMETLANCPIVLSVLNKSRAIESDYVYGY